MSQSKRYLGTCFYQCEPLYFREGKGKDEKGDEIHLDYSQYLERVNNMALESYKSKKSKEQAVKGSTTLKGSTFLPGKSTMSYK